MADIRIKLTKSLIGSKQDQIATAHSLGLRKIGNETVQPNNSGQDQEDRTPDHRC